MFQEISDAEKTQVATKKEIRLRKPQYFFYNKETVQNKS